MASPPIYTIGHSNNNVTDFIGLLQRHTIEVVVDVRSAPYSRHVPRFNKREIEAAIRGAGMRYIFMGDLLGGKPGGSDFRDERGAVDYGRIARSQDFQKGIDRLLRGLNEGWTIALMCAEADPLKCHRHHLVAKWLEEQEVPVMHIRADGSILKAKEHLKAYSRQLPLF